MEMGSDIARLSMAVYKAMCEIIGDEDVVHFNRLRSTHREVHANVSFNIIASQVGILSRNMVVDSGSRAEGFNFPSSDFDIMAIRKDVMVKQSLSEEGDLSGSYVVLLTEKDNTRSGFVRLKMLNLPCQPASKMWAMGMTRLGPEYNLSNDKIKEKLCLLSKNMVFPFEPHGPCTSLNNGYLDLDLAVALSSKTWPKEAVGCVIRLLKCGWPSVHVVKDMVNDGCLFVPVGDKTSPYENIEWRMSFSLAEKRLVHFMSHTQFLTYGLLKLFLKEVIEKNSSIRGLLCSYFLKTLVFWEITDTQISWTPSCFFQNVWNCFRRLLSWINNEYCPNFFIPENNMFNGKIYGRTRQILLNTLSAYYRKGYLLFLEIPSIQVEVKKWHATPTRGISNVLRRSTVIKRFLQFITYTKMNTCSKIIMSLESSHSKIVEELKDFLQLHQLNFSCFEIMCRQIDIACRNRSRYLTERCLSHFLRASSPDCVRSKLFLALYFYRCKRYESAIYLLYKVIQKLEDAETSYTWETFADKYSRIGGDLMSISHGMRKFIATEVPLDSETCIPEIFDEYSTTVHTLNHILSPWVLAHFLLGLCHFWKGDSAQARVHLRDIRKCLRYRLRHISPYAYPKSWELLGIGQEIIGDFQQALLSYGEIEKCTLFVNATSDIQLLDVNKKRRSQLAAFLNME